MRAPDLTSIAAPSATTEAVRRMAVLEAGAPVMSIHLRTDPRDPANTARTPGWLIALRNGLRSVSRHVEVHGSRDDRLALRGLRARVDAELVALDADQRGRGLSWFLTADGRVDARFTLQLPPREDVVRWDERPYVSPLVDVADRGRPAGLVLIAGEAIRLLHWEAGRVQEPERSLYEFEPGEWRDYSAYTMTNPSRAAAGRHVATFDQRVEEWRTGFLRETADDIGARLDELGWQRLLLIGGARGAEQFAGALRDDVRDRVVAQIEASLLWEGPTAVADRLQPELDATWRREARALTSRALEAARGGGLAAKGWPEVLDTLIQGRVRHLVFAAGANPARDGLPPYVIEALGDPGRELLVERAVEQAVASGAEVTALPHEDARLLAPAGGVAATLRY